MHLNCKWLEGRLAVLTQKMLEIEYVIVTYPYSFTEQRNIWLVWIEGICRPQLKNVFKMMEYVFASLENIVGKGGNAFCFKFVRVFVPHGYY